MSSVAEPVLPAARDRSLPADPRRVRGPGLRAKKTRGREACCAPEIVRSTGTRSSSTNRARAAVNGRVVLQRVVDGERVAREDIRRRTGVAQRSRGSIAALPKIEATSGPAASPATSRIRLICWYSPVDEQPEPDEDVAPDPRASRSGAARPEAARTRRAILPKTSVTGAADEAFRSMLYRCRLCPVDQRVQLAAGRVGDHEGTRSRSTRSRMIASAAPNSPAWRNDLPTTRWARTGTASVLTSSGTT